MGSLLFCLLASVAIATAKHHKHREPIIQLNGAEELVGTIREDELVLSTVPQLAIASESGPVCRYDIAPAAPSDIVPFNIEVIDRFTGTALIRLKDSTPLDCKKSEYNLLVTAAKCDDEGIKSEPVKMKVSVKDTNNHEPVFEKPWYSVTVDEGKIYPELLRVAATDEDCGHPYGEICEYEITNGVEKLPFNINAQGVISNSAPLNSSTTHSYILTIVAHDCGMRKSKSALVTINIKPTCVEGLQGVADRLPYTASSGPSSLLSSALLSVCAVDSSCTVSSVKTEISIDAAHVEEVCGMEDTPLYTNESIKSCGLSAKAVSLLTEETSFAGSTEEEKQKDAFGGSSKAIIVPTSTFDGLIPDKFTLSFSMKHEAGTKEEQKGKEHILCESDESGMNRHHFSAYVRHCKLEVVLRREAGAAAEFRAAEWRWDTPEVCDGKWHSYAVLFDGIDNVQLVVDGKPFNHDDRNPEILDDWPLHQTKTVKSRLVVGGCWHGRSLSMAQFFKGSLSHVSLLAGSTESSTAIACARACPEQLHSQDGETSAHGTALTLTAKTPEEMQTKMREVKYSNSLEDPTPGHRGLRIHTTVQCAEQGKTITLPDHKSFIFVKRHIDPIVSISGQAVVNADQKAVRQGTSMLPGLRITVSQTEEAGIKDITAETKLDYCKVHLKPSRDMDLEYFSSPATLIASTIIDFEHDKQGMMLRGGEWASTYEKVLEKIHYFNTRPDAYTKRIYSVQCSIQQGRILSNEFIVTMSIDASDEATVAPVESAEELSRHYEPAFDQLGGSRLQNILEMELPRPKALLSHHGYDMGQGAVAGGAVAVVVVVCVGFLLVLLVVGVLKMRDTPIPRRHRRNRKNQDGMEWDDAGMNITMNPLDDVEKSAGGAEYSEEESSDGEDSEGSYHEEEEEEEEMSEEEDEETEILPVNHGAPPLEWDDDESPSAPSPTTSARPPSARSYRV